MKLPESVFQCMDDLRRGGYSCYCVGGCVRDWRMGLTPHDYDLCTDATPEQMKAVFAHRQLVLAGEKHGTVGVVTADGVVEITTFRTESGYQDNRHPDAVSFVKDVKLDLARRDFTVNAMAWSPETGLCDPFGGENDLKNRILRAVGDPATRFGEDSLRILRGVRFAVRFGLTPEENTLQAMFDQADLMENLARERVFDELCKLLPLVTADDLLRYHPVLTAVLPELAICVGFDQHNHHHAYDVFTHTAHVVETVPADLAVRWAALLHDAGKPATYTLDETGEGHFYGHAAASAQIADAVLRNLKAPNALRERVTLLAEHHMTKIEPTKKVVRRWLSRLGEEALLQLLQLQQADSCQKGTEISEGFTPFSAIYQLLEEIRQENACLSLKDLAVTGHDVMALGYTGKAIGQALNSLLEQVLDEKLPNEKQALLDYLKVL